MSFKGSPRFPLHILQRKDEECLNDDANEEEVHDGCGNDPIMSLSSVGRVLFPPVAQPAQTASQSGFVVPPDGTAAGPAAGTAATSAAQIAQAAPVGAALMLALQEGAAAGAGEREARRHGQELLAALAELQRALLSNGGGDALQRLALLTDMDLHATEPALAQVIGSIRLRARLELARATVAAERRSPDIA